MIPGILLLGSGAWAQDYVFPSSLDDYAEFYPTAYVDHGGSDWNCGDITYDGHRGNDFGVGGFPGMDAGRTVVAGAEGTVVATNDGEFDRCVTADCPGGGGFGNYVQIEHADGKSTYYAHLKQFSVAVSVGDTVTCGQALGEVGSSGFSTGPHLHFEVRNGGNVAEDPFDGPCSAPPSYWRSQGIHGALPDPSCGPPPVCEPASALVCGQTLTGANDDIGSTSATWRYGCSEWTYSGPELSFTFSTPLDEPVELGITGLGADLDLYLLETVACDGTGCLATSSNPDAEDETLTFQATANREYIVVIDGYDGAVSDFTFTVACVGVDPDPPDTGTTSPATGDTGQAVDPGPDGLTPPGVVPQDTTMGCTCDSSGSVGGSLAVGLAGWVLVRRRSRRAR